MNNFTDFILEARKNYDSESLLSSEISKYLNKVNKVIPKQVQTAIYLTQKYNLLDSSSIDEIRNASKSSLKKLSAKYDISDNNMAELWQLLKDIKSNIRLLPQYQTAQERESLMLGKLSMDDLTIDLDSQQGRNAATKVYMPMIYKIVNQYLGKSSLSKQELMSAALVGFTSAMNDWKRKTGDEDEENKVTFKTYAAYRAKQQILNDMNELSHTLSGTNWYATKNYGDKLDAFSLDGILGDDNGEFKQDRLAILGVSDADWELNGDESKQWKSLFDLLEKMFTQREVNIFYRFFGLNGYKKEKSKDIAKSYGMSEGNIRNSIINKMINFLKKDKKANNILTGIQSIYNEALMAELVGFNKQEILEALANDDTFILLEELNRWNNKDVFKNAFYNALDKINISDSKKLIDIFKGDFETIDSNYRKNKRLISFFLGNMYPAENMSRKTDVSLIEYMEEIQKLYQKYKLD